MAWNPGSRASSAPPRALLAYVARPRLEEAVAASLGHRRLVLVCAPAGSGKTAVLSRALARPALRVGWVSLNEADDLQSLIALLCLALDEHDLPWRTSPDELPAVALRLDGLARVAEALCTALDGAEAAAGGVIVLDDLHHLTDARVPPFLDAVLAQWPAHWTLVLSTRMQPPMRSLPRLRAAGEVLELRDEHLRFTADEARALLAHSPASPQDAGEVQAWHSSTAGWAAGLGLWMLARRAGAGGVGGHRLTARRHIFEYLAQEVLHELPADLQAFVLRCSVLPVWTAARCARVSGDRAAAGHLQEILRRDLFVTEMDQAELALRPHDLFREFLEEELQRRWPEDCEALLARAAADEPDLAARVGLRLRGGDVPAAAEDLVEAAPQVLEQWGPARLLALVERFPSEARAQSAELAWVQALCGWHQSQPKTIVSCATRAVEAFERCGRAPMVRRSRAVLSLGLTLLGRHEEARQAWQPDPQQVDADGRLLDAFIAYWLSTLLGPGEDTPSLLLDLADAMPNADTGFGTMIMSMLWTTQGRWGNRPAMETLLTLVESRLGPRSPHLEASTAVLRAWMTAWTGRIDEAQAQGDQVRQDLAWLADPPLQTAALVHLQAWLTFLKGDHEGAQGRLQALQDAAQLSRRPTAEIYRALQGLLAAGWGDWARVEAFLQALGPTLPQHLQMYGMVRLPWTVVRAENELRLGRALEAEALLRPHLERSFHADHCGIHTRLRVSLARAGFAAGRHEQAWMDLAPALDEVERSGELLPLLMCGETALRELQQRRDEGLAPRHWSAVWRQLAERQRPREPAADVGGEPTGEAAARARTPVNEGSAEGGSLALLSERERQVAERVARGDSNKLIARELDLSPHTVKRHVARIFDKVGLASRARLALWYHNQSQTQGR